MQYLLLRLNKGSKLSIIFIGLLVFISGCGGGVNIAPTLTAQSQLKLNQGIVVARVINTSGYSLPFNQLTITPDNLNESKKIKPERMGALVDKQKGVTVFAAQFNQGTYALSSIRSYHVRGEYWYSRFISSDAKFGTFDVKAGQVTDLGTIIFYQKPQDDKYIETLLRLPEPDLGEVLTKYFPFYQFDKANLLTWNDDGKSEERESLYVSAAQNPINFDKTYLAPDKSMYFLGQLGVIVKRAESGDWELDGVDTNLKLTSIAQNKKGDLIVGGVEGKLFFKPAGQEWQDISLDHDEQVTHLRFYNETNIDMFVQRDMELKIFRSPILPQGLSWQELNKFDSLKGWKSIENTLVADVKKKKATARKTTKMKIIASVNLTELEDTHFIDVRTLDSYQNSLFSNGSANVFTYDPETWKMSTPEKKLGVTAVIDAGAVKLGITEAGFWSWSGKPDYSIYDRESQQWKEISTAIRHCPGGELQSNNSCKVKKKITKSKSQAFTFIAVPLFTTESDGIAIVRIANKDVAFLETHDAGNSWVKTEGKLPKKFCTKLITEISDRLLISCDGATGDFYESNDHGINWEHVRQQENF